MNLQGDKLSLERLTGRHTRALLAEADGTLHIGRHTRIYRSRDDGVSWSHVTSLPRPLSRRLAETSRLATRLLRHEIKALGRLADGTYVAANRVWVFHARPGAPLMERSRINDAGQPLSPPMTLTVGPSDRILFGEYNSKTAHNLPVRLFVSDDGGRSYEVARVFEAGSILHIHNLVYDADLDHYWVLAGDHEHEPGIGRLSADLSEFDWVAKGEQEYRAVEVFDFDDHLVYGMDSNKAPNAVMRFDKKSGRVERLHELDGSCIYACRFGGIYALSTTVEPSSVNHSSEASLWISRDGEKWSNVLRAPKDRWHPVLFQFGSLVLPRGASNRETMLFSGQALKNLDGRAYVARVREGLSSDASDERTASQEHDHEAR